MMKLTSHMKYKSNMLLSLQNCQR